MTSLPFDGYCVGGSLGKNRDELVGVGPLLPLTPVAVSLVCVSFWVDVPCVLLMVIYRACRSLRVPSRAASDEMPSFEDRRQRLPVRPMALFCSVSH